MIRILAPSCVTVNRIKPEVSVYTSSVRFPVVADALVGSGSSGRIRTPLDAKPSTDADAPRRGRELLPSTFDLELFPTTANAVSPAPSSDAPSPHPSAAIPASRPSTRNTTSPVGPHHRSASTVDYASIPRLAES